MFTLKAVVAVQLASRGSVRWLVLPTARLIGHVETVVSNVFSTLSLWLSECFQSRIIALLATVIRV
jgi:hypothetical protein